MFRAGKFVLISSPRHPWNTKNRIQKSEGIHECRNLSTCQCVRQPLLLDYDPIDMEYFQKRRTGSMPASTNNSEHFILLTPMTAAELKEIERVLKNHQQWILED